MENIFRFLKILLMLMFINNIFVNDTFVFNFWIVRGIHYAKAIILLCFYSVLRKKVDPINLPIEKIKFRLLQLIKYIGDMKTKSLFCAAN